MTATVSARGLTHRYGSLEALQEVDLEIPTGEVFAIVGPSGCGKSTLLQLVGGLDSPAGGTLSVAGVSDESGRLARAAWMPQRDCLLPWYSAIDNAGLALVNQGRSKREARAAARERFEHFGLAGFESARPDELSGGMRQRVAFIRTLLSGKPVMLLDEPLAALDTISRGELQAWLTPALAESGATVLLVTHDVEEALYLADRVAVLSPRPGRIVTTVTGARGETGSREEIVSSVDFNRRRQELLGLLATGGSRS